MSEGWLAALPNELAPACSPAPISVQKVLISGVLGRGGGGGGPQFHSGSPNRDCPASCPGGIFLGTLLPHTFCGSAGDLAFRFQPPIPVCPAVCGPQTQAPCPLLSSWSASIHLATSVLWTCLAILGLWLTRSRAGEPSSVLNSTTGTKRKALGWWDGTVTVLVPQKCLWNGPNIHGAPDGARGLHKAIWRVPCVSRSQGQPPAFPPDHCGLQRIPRKCIPADFDSQLPGASLQFSLCFLSSYSSLPLS